MSEQPKLTLNEDLRRLWSGGTLYGVRCQQTWGGLYLLERLLGAHTFKGVVEYGTGHGALAVFLACWAVQQGLTFVTVEKYQGGLTTGGVTDTKLLLGKLGVLPQDLDCLQESTAVAMVAQVPAPRLWVLDNGNKPLEAALVATVAGDDDLLAVHDYGTEMGDARIPAGWEKHQPWQEQADSIGSKYLVLRKVKVNG